MRLEDASSLFIGAFGLEEEMDAPVDVQGYAGHHPFESSYFVTGDGREGFIWEWWLIDFISDDPVCGYPFPVGGATVFGVE